MRTRRDEGGSAAVEFALVLPLVLMVILALLQVGVFARDRVLVEAAARAGARAAALADDPAEVAAAAQAAAPGLDPAGLAVTTSRSGTRGDPVTVSVVYTDPVRVPLVGRLVGGDVTMRAEATLRQEFT
jgi:Flp pilus assembly protein TadG